MQIYMERKTAFPSFHSIFPVHLQLCIMDKPLFSGLFILEKYVFIYLCLICKSTFIYLYLVIYYFSIACKRQSTVVIFLDVLTFWVVFFLEMVMSVLIFSLFNFFFWC